MVFQDLQDQEDKRVNNYYIFDEYYKYHRIIILSGAPGPRGVPGEEGAQGPKGQYGLQGKPGGMGGPGKPVSGFGTNLKNVRIRLISSLARVQLDKLVQKENRGSQAGLEIRAYEVMQGLQGPKVCKDMLERLGIQEIKAHKA